MKLSIQERLVINALYPAKTNLVEQILVKDIVKKTELTQEDIKKYNIKFKNDSIVWTGKPIKKVNFTDTEIEFLRKRVTELDKQNLITFELVDLCLKIQDK